MLSQFQGEHDRAEQLLDEALEISQRIGERTTRPWILDLLAEVMWRRGRLGEAYTRAHEALDLAHEIQHEEWTATSHMTLSMVNLALYRYDNAREHAATGHEWAVECGGFWLQLLSGFQQGVIALQAGDVAGAVAFFEPAMAQVRAANLGMFISLGAPWLAMAYAAQGKVDQARELIEDRLADPTLQRMGEVHLMTKYAHGRILEVAGDVEDAEAALEEALTLARHTGNIFMQIEIHRTLARFYRDQGRLDDADRQFGWVLQLGEKVAGTIDDPELRAAYLAAPPFSEAKGE